jgi:hypothetical protein
MPLLQALMSLDQDFDQGVIAEPNTTALIIAAMIMSNPSISISEIPSVSYRGPDL